MKICLISHAYTEVGYRPILEALAKEPGVDLALFTPSQHTFGSGTPTIFGGSSDRYRIYALPIHWGSRQGAFIYRLGPLLKALDEFTPDVILHEQEVFALGALQIAWLANRRSIPLVMFVWENVYRSLSLPRRLIRNSVLRRTAGLIAGSSHALRVHRDWGFKGEGQVITQMGCEVSPNPIVGRRAADAFRVCFAGRLIQSKGVDTLLRSVARMASRGFPVKCIIVGQGPEMDSLKALASELSIADRVVFRGNVPMKEVFDILRESDVLVLPSRRTKAWEEQFGRVLVEAMAQATVTVGSRTGAIPEVIGSDDLIFEEDDDAALADILMRLDKDSDLFLRHQWALWERARSCYQYEVVAGRKVDLMRRVFLHGS
jgi:glycosyltransferase involved in cell wall biosynthesis